MKSKCAFMEEEETSPSHGSTSSSQSYNSSVPDSTLDSDLSPINGSNCAANMYTFSEEKTYNSDDDFTHSNLSPINDSNCEANMYTFSEEKTYNSDDDDDDFTQEVTSYNTTHPPPPKRPKTTLDQTLDQISALPDSILLHILSFLPTEDSVATGTLSKRWQYLWTSIPNLVFRHRGYWGDGLRDFISFVNRTVLLYGTNNIKKFLIDIDFHKLFEDRVSLWVRFATRHNVEELDLHFYGQEDIHLSEGEHYTLPQYIYDYAQLKELKLRFCEIVPNRAITWKLLKKLSISYARLSDELVEKLLLGSPELEYFELYKCGGFSRLDVKTSSLRELVVNDSWDSSVIFDDDELLEISGPHLRSLSLLGFLYQKKCRVRNVSSLIDASLSFRLFTEFEDDHEYYEVYGSMLRELLENLHHVKELTIGTWCIQVLSICELKVIPSPLLKCKHLTLDTYLNSCWDLPGVANLLRSSPDLEKLMINMTCLWNAEVCNAEFDFDSNFKSSHNFEGKNFWTSQKMDFKSILLNLRTIEIVDFIADLHEIDLIVSLMEFLLKNASVLEKMVIYTQGYNRNRWWIHGCPEDLLKVGQSLLSFPRSSPLAEILLFPIKDSH